MTFDKMMKIEPELKILYSDILRVTDDCSKSSFCANRVWYGYDGPADESFRERLISLVGFDAKNPKLRTSRIYDCAYGKLYGSLPDCRNCNCM